MAISELQVGLIGAGGVVVVKADPDIHRVRRGGVRQFAVCFLREKCRDGQHCVGPGGRTVRRGGCGARHSGFRQNRGDAQLVQDIRDGLAAGVPQRCVAPLTAAVEGGAPGLQSIHGPDGIVIEEVLVELSPAPLYRNGLLAHQQPPVDVLTGGHRPDLRGRGQRRIDEAELSGRTYLGEGFQHHRRRGKAPLSGGGSAVLNGHGHRTLALPLEGKAGERVGGGGRFRLAVAGQKGAACQQRRKVARQSDPQTRPENQDPQRHYANGGIANVDGRQGHK